MVDCYVGEIRMLALPQTRAPEGWHFCDGSLLQISAYPALYALIGTTYGGDGVQTFAVPDYRSRLPIGAGAEGGTSPVYAPGAKGGLEKVTLTAANMPAHTHPWTVSTSNAGEIGPGGNLYATVPTGKAPAGQPTGGLYADTTATTFKALTMDSSVIGAAGSNEATHENRMPSRAISFVIALLGLYPVQA